MPDLSPYQTSRRERELERGIAELHSLDMNNLNQQSRMGYQMMELFLRRELFNSKDLKPLENNPMRHLGHLNVTGYIRRNYAPLEDRLRSATKIMTQAPDFLDVLDKRLVDNLSSHVTTISSESYAGMARFYRVDLSDVTKGVKDSEIITEFNNARKMAAAALDKFANRLKSRGASGPEGFAIGPDLYSGMLITGEGLDVPLRRIAAIGQKT